MPRWNRLLKLSLQSVLVMLLLVLVFPARAQSNDAHLRIGHFTLDTGALDIYVDGTLFMEGQALATLSEWRTLPAEAHTITVTMQGASIETPLLTPSQISLNAGEWVTLALVGRRAPGTLRLQALLENYSPIKTGETRLSVFHAFYPNPPINVTANGTPVIVGLAYPGTLGANDGMETVNLVARNRYELAISLIDGTAVDTVNLGMGQYRHYFIGLTGTMDNPIPVVVVSDLSPATTATPVPAEPTTAPTDVPTQASVPTEEIVVTDEAIVTEEPAPTATTVPEATPLSDVTPTAAATPIQVAAGQTLLRVGHFSPGAPDFSIYLNGTELIPLLPYPTLSDYLPIDAGTYEMAVVIEGEPLEAAVLRQSITVPAGGVMTLMVIGSLDTGTFQLQPLAEDVTPLRPGLARIAIFHAVPDAPFLNLIANDTLLVDRVAFPGTFAGGGDGFYSVDVLATDYRLEAELDEAQTINLGTLRMGAGRYYFIVIAGLSENAFYVLKSFDLAELPRGN